MVYVFFTESESWKSDDLIELQDFVKQHFGIRNDWIEFEVGEKLAISECGRYSLESCKPDSKYFHQIPTIGEAYIRVELQN